MENFRLKKTNLKMQKKYLNWEWIKDNNIA